MRASAPISEAGNSWFDSVVIDGDTFIRLLNKVLPVVGRTTLDPGGPQVDIIRVLDSDRVLQILAGPGSGKTEMLVWRVLYELFVIGTPSPRVMVTTFTKRAATELAVRVVERSDELIEQGRLEGTQVGDPYIHDLRIGTIHSLCDSLLAEFDLKYMESGSQVIDDIETRVRMARIHRFLGYAGQGKPPRVIDRLISCKELVSLFRAPWDNLGWPTNAFDRVSLLLSLLAQQTETWIPRCLDSAVPNGIESTFGIGSITADIQKLQSRWFDYLDSQHVLDFPTIQLRFLQGQSSILDQLDHVFVDEFQDTNPIQLAIHLGWLSRHETRLTVVGDDDQSMYRFRGSDIGCFIGLEGMTKSKAIPFRQEKLEKNWRSTKTISSFSEAFRRSTILAQVSMPKKITSPETAANGSPVRLIQGPWLDLCRFVASEVDRSGAGRVTGGTTLPPSTAILMFSTSEKRSRRGSNPASEMVQALTSRGLRSYNPRNKTAAQLGSPVHTLAALVSYLFDPVTMAPVGKGGRMVQVWASCAEHSKAKAAVTNAPPFPVSPAHAQIQKQFIRSDGDIGAPGPGSRDLLMYLDQVRSDLIQAIANGDRPRLTLSGLIARLLSFPIFRTVGFTPALFRQALFTQILEANIAPTRLTMSSLDNPLKPQMPSLKVQWPNEVWSFLNTFGSLLQETDLDDLEVEELADDAIALLTFHQTKGLEFDHVFLALTGREPAIHAVLRTILFSGQKAPYRVNADGQPESRDKNLIELATADREREVYVALTRARSELTILHDPSDQRPMAKLNPGLEALFSTSKPTEIAGWATLTVRTWANA